MTSEDSFAVLMTRLREGDPDAATQIFNRFAHRLIAMAHGRLDGQIRQKVGPEDVVQSVFKSFFLRHAGGQFVLRNWDSLWSLLVVITLRKCGRKIEHFHGPHADVRREISSAGHGEALSDWEMIATDPTPEEAAILAETVSDVMRGLKEREQQILSLRLQGYSVPEISVQVGRTEYTVEGVLKRIRQKLQHLREQV